MYTQLDTVIYLGASYFDSLVFLSSAHYYFTWYQNKKIEVYYCVCGIYKSYSTYMIFVTEIICLPHP